MLSRRVEQQDPVVASVHHGNVAPRENLHIPDIGEHGCRVVFAAPNDEVGLAGQGATLHEAQGRGAEVHDAYASAVEDGGEVAGG